MNSHGMKTLKSHLKSKEMKLFSQNIKIDNEYIMSYDTEVIT
jgi:hypothetical protein